MSNALSPETFGQLGFNVSEPRRLGTISSEEPFDRALEGRVLLPKDLVDQDFGVSGARRSDGYPVLRDAGHTSRINGAIPQAYLDAGGEVTEDVSTVSSPGGVNQVTEGVYNPFDVQATADRMGVELSVDTIEGVLANTDRETAVGGSSGGSAAGLVFAHKVAGLAEAVTGREGATAEDIDVGASDLANSARTPQATVGLHGLRVPDLDPEHGLRTKDNVRGLAVNVVHGMTPDHTARSMQALLEHTSPYRTVDKYGNDVFTGGDPETLGRIAFLPGLTGEASDHQLDPRNEEAMQIAADAIGRNLAVFPGDLDGLPFERGDAAAFAGFLNATGEATIDNVSDAAKAVGRRWPRRLSPDEIGKIPYALAYTNRPGERQLAEAGEVFDARRAQLTDWMENNDVGAICLPTMVRPYPVVGEGHAVPLDEQDRIVRLARIPWPKGKLPLEYNQELADRWTDAVNAQVMGPRGNEVLPEAWAGIADASVASFPIAMGSDRPISVQFMAPSRDKRGFSNSGHVLSLGMSGGPLDSVMFKH